MKGPAIDQLVYDCMFPKPKSNEPSSFQALLREKLVPEVRLETHAFYGHLSSQEAKYPGLDYSYQPHRVRLSRYTWHRRLFRAFDSLGLTNSEIASLTKWEGTRWAKERFEREQGIIIRDTTADSIANWVEPEDRVPVASPSHYRQDIDEITDRRGVPEVEYDEQDPDSQMDEDGDEESDVEVAHSIGVALNERLREAAAQREAGVPATVMDADWEQWYKENVEAGGIDIPFSEISPHANIPGTRPAPDTQSPPHSQPYTPAMHLRLLNATRLSQWHRIPDVLHTIMRQNVENTTATTSNSLTSNNANRRRGGASTTTQPSLSSSSSHSGLNRSPSPFLARPNLPPRASISNSHILNNMTPVRMSLYIGHEQNQSMPRLIQLEASRAAARAQTGRVPQLSVMRSTQQAGGPSGDGS